jgi:transposase
MKCVIDLSEVDEITLQQLSINHRHRDARTRAVGLLWPGRKVKQKVIAEQPGVSDQSVYNWARAWHDRGVCALTGGHNGGRPRALSESMVATAAQMTRAEPLTLGQIEQRVQEIRGEVLSCCIEKLGEALKREGFSFKRKYPAKKRDEEAFAMKQAALDKLQLAARDGQCHLFYLDEAGICVAPSVQRSWSPRGLPHAIELNSHCRRSIIGALDFGQNTHDPCRAHAHCEGTLHVVEFIEALVQQGDGKPTVIVLETFRI